MRCWWRVDASSTRGAAHLAHASRLDVHLSLAHHVMGGPPGPVPDLSRFAAGTNAQIRMLLTFLCLPTLVDHCVRARCRVLRHVRRRLALCPCGRLRASSSRRHARWSAARYSWSGHFAPRAIHGSFGVAGVAGGRSPLRACQAASEEVSEWLALGAHAQSGISLADLARQRPETESKSCHHVQSKPDGKRRST